MKKTVLMAVVCAALAGGLAWAAVSRGHVFARRSNANAIEVKIDNYSFAPGDLTVKAGTTVSWVNHDDVPHTVKANDGSFKSKALDTDDKFTMTFDKPGVYEYYCSVHPRMTAKIVVK
jgi:plastocyanin